MVPYYQDLYPKIDEYARDSRTFNEAEQLSIEMINRLSNSPENIDTFRNSLGADKKLFSRAIEIGETGNYLIKRRSRGRDILLSHTYFSENADLFADIVASGKAKNVKKILDAIKSLQGIPLSLIEKQKTINNCSLNEQDIAILKRLAQDGAVKPPSIKTSYSGENFFLFTPTPGDAVVPPSKRNIYEKAMAIVAAVRQGQFLPKEYAIRSPAAVIYTLKDKLKLGKATTEATQQYRQLVHLRVGQLIPVGNEFSDFHIIDTDENKEALDIAYSLVEKGTVEGIEVDEDARKALQQEQEYVESIIGSSKLREREKVKLNEAQQLELDLILSGGKL